MNKVFTRLALCLVFALAAFCAVGCTSGANSSTSGSSSASNAVQLDKQIEQKPLTYSVNAQWKQSGGATGQTSSEYKFETGDGANSLTIKVEDAAFVESPSAEFDKLRVNWVDYQGATNWQASNASQVKVGNKDCTVYQCSWKLKNGKAVNMKVGYIPAGESFIIVSYFYESGDAAVFDAVLASIAIK